MNRDMPDIRHSTYATSTASPFEAVAGDDGINYLARVANRNPMLLARGIAHSPEPFTPQEQPMASTPRRLVQVFIVDPHPDVPIETCLLHKGEMLLTDLTDQELFYEIDLKVILAAHNAMRTTLIDKSVKDRVQKLEPARIRDLRMQIVTVATF